MRQCACRTGSRGRERSDRCSEPLTTPESDRELLTKDIPQNGPSFPTNDPDQPISWNTQTIITRAALSSLEKPDTTREVRVISLAEFLSRVTKELPSLIEWYWDLLARKTGVSRGDSKRPGRIRTEPEFVAALRLNPLVPLRLVRALRPDEVSPQSPHDHWRYGPPRNVYADTREGESITSGEVLATFSDEPDWGMDQDLFTIKEY